jgi:hypothetical protein
MRDVEFVLGQVLQTLGELFPGFRRFGRFRILAHDGFKVALGDFGIFLIAIGAGKLVEVRLPQAQGHEWNMFIGRVHGLKFFEGVDRFRVLLVAIVGIGDLQLHLCHQRAERMVGANLGVVVESADVAFVVEVAVPFGEKRFRGRVGFRAG